MRKSIKIDSIRKSSVITRFRIINIIVLVIILMIVTMSAFFIFTSIANNASKDYARFYSVSTKEKFELYIDKDLTLVKKISYSKALTNWFLDEDNPTKRQAAYGEIMDYAQLLPDAILYCTVDNSKHAYPITSKTTYEEMFEEEPYVVSIEEDYDEWYFDLIDSNIEYALDIDIELSTKTPRLWINAKVYDEDNQPIGVFSSGINFNSVIKGLFSQYNSDDVHGYIIDNLGNVRIDSEYAIDINNFDFIEVINIYDVNLDSSFRQDIQEHLNSINGYFDMNIQSTVMKISKGKYSYASIAPISGTDWTVVSFYKSSSLFDFLNFLPIFIIAITAFIIYAFINIVLSRRQLLLPLNYLTESISNAKTDETIYGIERNDEFGILAKTVKDMCDRLNSFNREILIREKNQEHQRRLLYAVNGAAEVLLATDEDKFEDSLLKGMKLMADCMGVDRINIWKNELINEILYYKRQFEYEKNKEQTSAQIHTLYNFAYEESIPEWEIRFIKGEIVNGPLSVLSSVEQNKLKEYDIKSILVIPVYLQEVFWGFVSFDDCHSERFFSDDEISILRSGSLMLANAISKNEMISEQRAGSSKMEAVITNYPGVIFSVDQNNMITLFNGLSLNEIGINPKIIVGKNISSMQETYWDSIINERISKTLEDGSQEWVSEIGGKMFHAHTKPIYDKNGNVTAVVGTLDDITDSIRMQKELQNALEAAQTASQAKGDFLSNMSHEMRTPMNAIIGMTSIAKFSKDMVKKNYCLEKIENASTHLLGVINDILDMSKIEANKFNLSYVDFKFEDMIQKVIDVIYFRIEEKHQQIMVFLDKRIPNLLNGDDQHLSQVITNLLSNAVKFTPDYGMIQLSVKVLEEKKGIYTLQISVKDNGIGISEEQQTKLFTSFQQAESSTSRRFGGTGLGLAISKKIVEMMDGNITVESKLGEGANFIFTVQLEISKNARLLPIIHFEEIRLLVIDNSNEVLEYFKYILNESNIKANYVSNLNEATTLIKENDYDLYFVPGKTAEISGFEIMKAIHHKNPDKPIVMIVHPSEWAIIEEEAKEFGITKYITKPIFPSRVIQCIQESLYITEFNETQDNTEGIDGCFEGYWILLAEDIEINREIVIEMLSQTKISIDIAENGEEAANLFINNPNRYQLILMDMQMPKMDGLEATKLIRASRGDNAKKVPIIAMTANVFKEDVDKCLEAGMNDHIGKPLDFVEMLNKMKYYLNFKK